MELEEMKTLWAEMSAEIEKQKTITDSLIIKMTRAGYRNQINKILIPEIIGVVGCLTGSVLIIINLRQLNTWYLLVCGITAAVLLLLLPMLSLKAISGIRSINISTINYKQSLLEYSKGKLRFVFFQKLNFYLAAVLTLVISPVIGWLINGKDLFIESRLWIIYAIGWLFFYLISRWVFKSYLKKITDAENILKELES